MCTGENLYLLQLFYSLPSLSLSTPYHPQHTVSTLNSVVRCRHNTKETSWTLKYTHNHTLNGYILYKSHFHIRNLYTKDNDTNYCGWKNEKKNRQRKQKQIRKPSGQKETAWIVVNVRECLDGGWEMDAHIFSVFGKAHFIDENRASEWKWDADLWCSPSHKSTEL